MVDVLNETLLADDRRPYPKPPTDLVVSVENYQEYQKATDEWERYYFPQLGNEMVKRITQYLSRPFLAVVVLGSTGWSGWHETEKHYWTCRLEDLTD